MKNSRGIGITFESSDEEQVDDYMADDFVTNVAKVEKEMGYQKLRQRKENESFLKSLVKSKELEKLENLDKSQAAPIPVENKGFQLLQKMGFKPELRLGLGEKGKEGIAEPISVELPRGKSGIGSKSKTFFESSLKRKQNEESLEKKKKRYLSASAEKHARSMMERDLRASMSACQDLDEKNDRERTPFWTPGPKKGTIFFDPGIKVTENSEPNDEINFNILSVPEKLEMVTEYVRNEYFYCIWCSIEYNDQKDLDENCPGDQREDHDL